jgi:hypothetical protein
MSIFFTDDGIYPKTVAALRQLGHETRPVSFRKEGELELILNQIYVEKGILLTADRRFAERLRDTYALRPGIILCPANPPDDAVIHSELAKIIHGVVSGRESFIGNANGLFFLPKIGGITSSRSRPLWPDRVKRQKRRP